MNMLTRTLRSIRTRRHNLAAPPAALTALAGQPAGLRDPHRTRRGTVLVLILGALALISVVTLVYVVVGRGDRLSDHGRLAATGLRRRPRPQLPHR